VCFIDELGFRDLDCDLLVRQPREPSDVTDSSWRTWV
jgi:hypothetical protein